MYKERSGRDHDRGRSRSRDRDSGRSRGNAARDRSRDGGRDNARRRSKSRDRSSSRGNINSRDLIPYRYTDTIVPQRDSRDFRDRDAKLFPEDPARIYVGNLGQETTEGDVRNRFEKIGAIDSMFSNGLGKSKDYVFIKFVDTESAIRAIQTMNDVQLNGRPLKVQRAYSRKGGDHFPNRFQTSSPTTSPFPNLQHSNSGVDCSGYHREREARFNNGKTNSRSRSRSRDKQQHNLEHHHKQQYRDDNRGRSSERASDNLVSVNDSATRFNDKKRSRSGSPSFRDASFDRDDTEVKQQRLSPPASAIVNTIPTIIDANDSNHQQQQQQNVHPNDRVYSISPPLTPREDRSISLIEQYDLGYKTQCQNYYNEHSGIIESLKQEHNLLKEEHNLLKQQVCKLEKVVSTIVNSNVNNNNNGCDFGVTQKFSPTLSPSQKESTIVEKETTIIEKEVENQAEKDNTDPTTSTTPIETTSRTDAASKKEVIIEDLDIYSEF